MRDSEKIRAAYDEALKNPSYIDGESAAEHYAMETALTIVMERHRCRDPYAVTEEMANEARQMYISAVVGTFFNN